MWVCGFVYIYIGLTHISNIETYIMSTAKKKAGPLDTLPPTFAGKPSFY